MIKKEQVAGLQEYLDVLTPEQIQLSLVHCQEHGLLPKICAWYENEEDFAEDWMEHLGYTYKEAMAILEEGEESGEFKQFEDGSIVRFEY